MSYSVGDIFTLTALLVGILIAILLHKLQKRRLDQLGIRSYWKKTYFESSIGRYFLQEISKGLGQAGSNYLCLGFDVSSSYHLIINRKDSLMVSKFLVIKSEDEDFDSKFTIQSYSKQSPRPFLDNESINEIKKLFDCIVKFEGEKYIVSELEIDGSAICARLLMSPFGGPSRQVLEGSPILSCLLSIRSLIVNAHKSKPSFVPFNPNRFENNKSVLVFGCILAGIVFIFCLWSYIKYYW